MSLKLVSFLMWATFSLPELSRAQETVAIPVNSGQTTEVINSNYNQNYNPNQGSANYNPNLNPNFNSNPMGGTMPQRAGSSRYPNTAGPVNPNNAISGLKCPYQEKSSEADQFLATVRQKISEAKNALENNRDKCKMKVDEIQTSLTSLQTSIDQLRENQFPSTRSLKEFKIGSTPYVCPARKDQFYTFVSTYIRQRVIENFPTAVNKAASGDSYLSLSGGVSGQLGETIEQHVSKCLMAAASGNSASRVEASEEGATSCVFSNLSFNPGLANNPTSPLDQQWSASCGGGNLLSEASAEYKKEQEVVDQKRERFKSGMQLLTESTTKLTGFIGGDVEEKCQIIKSSVNAAMRTGLGIAGSLAGPWGSFGSGLMTPIVGSIVNTLGSNSSTIRRLNALEKDMKETNASEMMQSFSCHVFAANQLNCEFLNRVKYDTQNKSCASSTSDFSPIAEKNMNLIMSLKNSMKATSGHASEGSDELSDEDADQLYTKMFVEKIRLPNGADESIFEFIFHDGTNNLPKGIFNTFEEAWSKNSPNVTRNATTKTAMNIMTGLRSALIDFKKEFNDNLNDVSAPGKRPKFSHGAAALKLLNGDGYSNAMKAYLALSMKEDQKDVNGIDTAIATSLKMRMDQGIINALDPGIPNQADQTADLTSKLSKFYSGYLGEDSVIRNFFIFPELKRSWETNKTKISANLNEAEAAHLEGGVKDPETVYAKYIYPAFRDCMLNYQFAVEGQHHDRLNEDYKKMCSFLSACKGEKNTLGLPFELDSKKQGDPDATNTKDFVACTLVNNYRIIEDRLKKEVLNYKADGTYDGKICGADVKDALKALSSGK